MRISFWTRLTVWIVAWAGGLIYEFMRDVNDLPFMFSMAAIFFTFYFCTSLTGQRRVFHFLLWLLLIVVVVVTFSIATPSPNPYIWLILGLAWIAITEQFYGRYFWGLVMVLALSICVVGLTLSSPLLISLLIMSSGVAFIVGISYQYNYSKMKELELRYQALIQTYRQLKRDSVSNQQHVRQQERVQIGREIHDRVGHVLTNLLMQIETLRLQANHDSTSNDLNKLKGLAQESLQETRRAVKAFRDEEYTGVAAVMQLIRKLEAEHLLSIHFSMRQNALSIPLSGEQASVVYRVIQESLTNVMRHSPGKEAKITLEAPGGSYFRFEVLNPLEKQMDIKEGFGLQSMRDRIYQLNGSLEIKNYQDRFIVRGIFPIDERGEAVDSYFTS